MAGSVTRASLMRLSGRGPGCDHASQAESCENASPVTGPSSEAVSSRTCPVAISTRCRRPSRDAAATVFPSGAAASSATTPSSPAAIRRGPWPSAGPATGATSSASVPPASVTQTACPFVPRTRGSLARASLVTLSARAGPSRWVSQCTVPCTSMTLALPDSSQDTSPRCSAADTNRGATLEDEPVRTTSTRRGSASRLSSSQISPQRWYTTRWPSVLAWRA